MDSPFIAASRPPNMDTVKEGSKSLPRINVWSWSIDCDYSSDEKHGDENNDTSDDYDDSDADEDDENEYDDVTPTSECPLMLPVKTITQMAFSCRAIT